jgi:hypothetical protein
MGITYGHQLMSTTCGRRIRSDMLAFERLENPAFPAILENNWLGNLEAQLDRHSNLTKKRPNQKGLR